MQSSKAAWHEHIYAYPTPINNENHGREEEMQQLIRVLSVKRLKFLIRHATKSRFNEIHANLRDFLNPVRTCFHLFRFSFWTKPNPTSHTCYQLRTKQKSHDFTIVFIGIFIIL